jgi:acyl-coenzyme A thioesterase PaaI-like protein
MPRTAIISAYLTARFADRTTNLATVQQDMVKDHTGHHGLAHGHSTDTNAGIVAAFSDNLGGAAIKSN